MDYTKKFVVYNKIEILKLEGRIDELVRENERLKELGEKCRELEFENIQLKNQLNQTRATDDENTSMITSEHHGHDQSQTMDFLQTQETSEAILRVNLTPNHSPITDGHQMLNSCLDHPINTDISDISNESSNIGYNGIGFVRRKSNFNVTIDMKDKTQKKTSLTKTQNQHRIQETVWSFPNLCATALSDLSKEMRNKCDKNIMFKIIAKEWNKKPENMSRMEFFYHLLTIFIENGVLIQFCTEHTPPCRPKVDTKILEKYAVLLKNFLNSVNRYKLIVIEVELLVALENVVYTQPKYRPAISDVMDILFRNGVVEAVAFGEWSQMDSQRQEEKTQLIREIRRSGFSLLKRSSSL